MAQSDREKFLRVLGDFFARCLMTLHDDLPREVEFWEHSLTFGAEFTDFLTGTEVVRVRVQIDGTPDGQLIPLQPPDIDTGDQRPS